MIFSHVILRSNESWKSVDGGKGLARIERDSKPSLSRHARIRASTFPRTGDRRSRTRACNTDLSPPRVGGEKTERLSAVGFSPYAHARSHSSPLPPSSLAKHVPNLEQRRRHANPWDLGPDASILPVFPTRGSERLPPPLSVSFSPFL